MRFSLLLHVWALFCLEGSMLAEEPGTDFAVVFMQNALPNQDKPCLEILLTAFFPGTQANISIPNTDYDNLFLLRVRSATNVTLPKELEMVNSIRSNVTVHITSNKPISVVATSRKSSTTSAVVVSSTLAWGTEYYVVTPEFGPKGSTAQMAMVNGPKPTTITITLNGPVDYENRTHFSGDDLQLMLGPWEAVQLQTNKTFTGSHIVSQEPIAVFAGRTCAGIAGQCNHICVQLPPVSAWGSAFLIPVSAFQIVTNIVYILAASKTDVKISSWNGSTSLQLAPGAAEELDADPTGFLFVKSSGRLMVSLYVGGGVSQSVRHNGFLINIFPKETACRHYSMVSLPDFRNVLIWGTSVDDKDGLELNHKALLQLNWANVTGLPFVSGGFILSENNGYNIISSPGQEFGALIIGMKMNNSYVGIGVCLDKVYESCEFECPSNQVCKKPCQSSDTLTCMAWGRTHLRTLNGNHLYLSGNCPSDLFDTKGDEESFGPFQVERRPASKFTVKLILFGKRLEVSSDAPGSVLVNGGQMFPPIILNDDRLSITRFGLSTLIKTSFGLQVVIGDQDGFLHLQIPSRYNKTLNGFCVGDFSLEPSELKPKQLLPMSCSTDKQESKCNPGIVSNLQTCEGKSFTKSNALCRLMVESEIFQACHAKLDPKSFVRSCEMEVCNVGEACTVIGAYARACGIEGVNLTGWRNISKCEHVCPQNSHYESCPSCPSTCMVGSDANCDGNLCYEACVCNEDHHLTVWGTCSRLGDCGCSFKGVLYPPGQDIYLDSCNTRCRCAGSMLECQATDGCDPGYKCQPGREWFTCSRVSSLTCSLYGDSHYTRFDGQVFTRNLSCQFTIVEVCSRDFGLEYFSLHLVQDKASFSRKVIISVYGSNLTLSQGGQVTVNGTPVQTPFALDNRSQIFRSGLQGTVLQSDFGLAVSFNSLGHLLIKVPASYVRGVCGLCSSAEDTHCHNLCRGICRSCRKDRYLHYLSPDLCGMLEISDGLFRGCHGRVNPNPYIEACVNDLCKRITVCDSFSSYAAACQEAGVMIDEWRSRILCDYRCPANSHYSTCAPGCPATCGFSLPLSCPLPCREGCVCNPGYILRDDRCVLPEQCGCYLEGGEYIDSGDTFYINQCGLRCTCEDSELSCYDHACSAGEECRSEMGIMACYPKALTCSVSGFSYQTFDKVSITVDDFCTYTMATTKCHNDSMADLNFEFFYTKNRWQNGYSKLAIYGYVLRLQGSQLEANSTFPVLPFNVDNKIKVSGNDGFTRIEAASGLVLVANASHVSIILPSIYAGKVCGLCGNTNGNDTEGRNIDDRLSKWRVNSNRNSCRDDVLILSVESHPIRPDLCETIVRPEGAFRDCHAVLDPQRFYNKCLADAGVNNLGEACRRIKDYTLQCQLLGINVYQWKNGAVCGQELSPEAPPTRPAIVVPQVNSLVTKSSPLMVPITQICVPPAKSGNQTHYPDKIRCMLSFMDETYNLPYSLQCSLVLASSCIDSVILNPFSVTLHHIMGLNHSASNLVVEVYGMHIIIPRNVTEFILVNREFSPFPACLYSDKVKVWFDAPYITLETDFGLVLRYSLDGDILILVPTEFKNHLLGQCSEGAVNTLKISSEPGEDDAEDDQCLIKVKKEGQVVSEDKVGGCSLILDENGPFKGCHQVSAPQSSYDGCRRYIREGGGDYRRVCNYLTEYTANCQRRDAIVLPWRNDSFCPYTCPQGAYEVCARPCNVCQGAGCPNITCREGCRCVEGLLWDGVHCVPSGQCGAWPPLPPLVTQGQTKSLHCHSGSPQEPPCHVCSVNAFNISTFGNISSEQNASGAYDVLRKCDPLAPEWMRVVLRLQPPSPPWLYIFFEKIFFMVNDCLEVWINGEQTRLPKTVGPSLVLSRFGDTFLLGWPGMMDLAFSTSGQLTIEVTERRSVEFCGACGFGNSLQKNNTIFSLDSWRAKDLS